jgi:hypothetical protein
MRVLRSLLGSTAWGVGAWATVALLAIVPAIALRGLWLLTLAEPLGDVAAATLSANIAGLVTWLGAVVAVRRHFRRPRDVGRHQGDVRDHVREFF